MEVPASDVLCSHPPEQLMETTIFLHLRLLYCRYKLEDPTAYSAYTSSSCKSFQSAGVISLYLIAFTASVVTMFLVIGVLFFPMRPPSIAEGTLPIVSGDIFSLTLGTVGTCRLTTTPFN